LIDEFLGIFRFRNWFDLKLMSGTGKHEQNNGRQHDPDKPGFIFQGGFHHFITLLKQLQIFFIIFFVFHFGKHKECNVTVQGFGTSPFGLRHHKQGSKLRGSGPGPD
jgi:hypothetical protein